MMDTWTPASSFKGFADRTTKRVDPLIDSAKQWVQDNGNTAVDAAEPLTRRVLGSAGGTPPIPRTKTG